MQDRNAPQRQYRVPSSELAIGQVVPLFELPDSRGQRVSLWGYKGRRNLVLFFFHGGDCALCRDALTRFAGHYPRYRELDAEVLAISRDPLPVARALAESLHLPFPVLSDPAGEVAERYMHLAPGEDRSLAAVFVADRYGALYHREIVEKESELPAPEQILDWLQFIGIQCDECGAPEWPAQS